MRLIELTELVLFALSVIPIPVINLIPDFMLIVHNLMNGKRIMFTILSSIDGQYLGPTPCMLPEYMALLDKFFLMIL